MPPLATLSTALWLLTAARPLGAERVLKTAPFQMLTPLGMLETAQRMLEAASLLQRAAFRTGTALPMLKAAQPKLESARAALAGGTPFYVARERSGTRSACSS
jgi:hypothetical protein